MMLRDTGAALKNTRRVLEQAPSPKAWAAAQQNHTQALRCCRPRQLGPHRNTRITAKADSAVNGSGFVRQSVL
eukprot:11227986-Alexandrium_andersonii.AAC.1